MSNITTDVNSFENIDYPKNIFELLLKLKNEPLQINCNSSDTSNSSDFKKYNSQETFLRKDDTFGDLFTITLFTELSCDFALTERPINFIVNEDLSFLDINNIIDYTVNLSDERQVGAIINEQFQEFFVKQFVNLNTLIYLDTNHAFLQIPTEYDDTDVNDIVNTASDTRFRTFKFYLTLVYTKNN